MTASPDVATGGLTELAVRARVDAGQVNRVPPAPGRSLPQILRANVLTRFNAILGALFVVVLVIGPPQDALFGVVLVVNTGIGVAQELRAKRALDRLAILTAGRARAISDGAVTVLEAGGFGGEQVGAYLEKSPAASAMTPVVIRRWSSYTGARLTRQAVRRRSAAVVGHAGPRSAGP
jgi:hypothetical protein